MSRKLKIDYSSSVPQLQANLEINITVTDILNNVFDLFFIFWECEQMFSNCFFVVILVFYYKTTNFIIKQKVDITKLIHFQGQFC